MADTLESVLIGGAAGVVSSVITYFSTRAKIRLDLMAAYDKDLQTSRLKMYLILWAALETLARYGRGDVTYTDLARVSGSTRDWYFKQGGIYLTRRSRDPYFRWKALLQPLLDDAELRAHPDTPIDPVRLEGVIAAASALRTSLSDDIGTKQLSRF
jgi:hypothetical protein